MKVSYHAAKDPALPSAGSKGFAAAEGNTAVEGQAAQQARLERLSAMMSSKVSAVVSFAAPSYITMTRRVFMLSSIHVLLKFMCSQCAHAEWCTCITCR